MDEKGPPCRQVGEGGHGVTGADHGAKVFETRELGPCILLTCNGEPLVCSSLLHLQKCCCQQIYLLNVCARHDEEPEKVGPSSKNAASGHCIFHCATASPFYVFCRFLLAGTMICRKTNSFRQRFGLGSFLRLIVPCSASKGLLPP